MEEERTLGTRWGINIRKEFPTSKVWGINVGFAHYFRETYLYFKFMWWSVSIGKMYKVNNDSF